VVGSVDDVLALGEVETMAAVVERDGQRHRALAVVLAIFATFAMSLAVLALYSALAYVVAQRSREIAIRAAVGASGQHIARLVLGEGIPLVIAGLVVGTGLSLALTRALQSQLYGVSASDAPTYLVIAAVLATAGVGALIFPVRQAMRVDPAAVLRAE
jgi:putative ABC transport system permease protein